MKKPSSTIERLGSAANALMGRRGRVALLLAGLSTLPAACHVSASFSLNRDPMDAMRNGALDRGDTKIISAKEAGVGITLGKVDREVFVRNSENKVEKQTKERIGGLIYIFTDSPLRTESGTKVYKLPEDAAPWAYLVQESSGTLTLRTKCDTLVLRFNCGDLTNVENRTCRGEEIPRDSVRKVCADGRICEKESTELTQPDAGAPDATHGNHDAGAPDSTTPDAQPDANETTGEVVEISDFQTEVLDVHGKPVLVTFETADCGEGCNWQNNVLGEVAKELGDEAVISTADANSHKDKAIEYGVQSLPSLRIFVDGQVVEQWEQAQQKDTLVAALRKHIGNGGNTPATDAGQTSTPDAGTNTSEAGTTPENAQQAMGEIEALLGSTPLEKAKQAAKMISVDSFHRDIDAEDKTQVTARIMDWLGQHHSGGDDETVMVVLRYLKGETTDEDREHIRKNYSHDIPN